MELYYSKSTYLADGSLAIWTSAFDAETGWLEKYGDVTVCLAGYGMTPDKDHIYMPTYKMTPEYRAQVLKDIAREVVGEVQIGYGKGLYVWLKEDWESGVQMV